MVNFPELIRPDFGELLGFDKAKGGGVQGAHVHGSSALGAKLRDLFIFMNRNYGDSLLNLLNMIA